jgi:DNA-binding transcriptional LysR family regulator
MELRHLRYFLAVAEALNFSRAAERLHVAQPALSRQIHDLEETVGFKLFQRTTARVRLTDAGIHFRQQAEKLLLQLDQAVADARAIAEGSRGRLRIGSDWNASALPITSAAHEFRVRHPDVPIDFVELPGFEHAAAVLDGRIDIGFVAGVAMALRTDVQAEIIHTCAMKAVLPVGHPLAAKAKVRMHDLQSERWIAIAEEEVPGFKTLTAQLMRPAQFTPRFGRTAQSLAGLLAFIGTGEGVGLIPDLFLPAQPEEVRYVGTDGEPFRMMAVWSRDAPAGHVGTYLEILRQKIAAGALLPATLHRSPSRRAAGKGRVQAAGGRRAR